MSEKGAGERNILARSDMLAVSEGTNNSRNRKKGDGYDVLVATT